MTGDEFGDRIKQFVRKELEKRITAPNCEVCGRLATGKGPDGHDLCLHHAQERLEDYDPDYVWLK